MSVDVLSTHIVVTPDACAGKPRIAGRRITVQHIAGWHERDGKSVDEIATEYDLSLGDVYAALAYYSDNRERIDRASTDDEEFINRLRKARESRVSTSGH